MTLISWMFLLLALDAVGQQPEQKVFAIKNANSFYAEQTMKKAMSPLYVRKVSEVPNEYKAIYFSPPKESNDEIQLMRERLSDVIAACNADPSCKQSGFANEWEKRDKITYNIFRKYLPVIEFNLHDPTGSQQFLERIEIQKLVYPNAMATGNDNVSIKPREGEGSEFIKLTKDTVKNGLLLVSPILFKNKFCSVKLILSSSHYDRIDIATLPGKQPCLIRVRFICKTAGGEVVVHASEPILVEI